MLAAVKGIIKGNTVVIEDEDLQEYDGTEVIVTMLKSASKKKRKEPIDLDKYVISSERGMNVEEYMKEMRENDRM